MDVLETCLYARDLERAREFYEDLLGLECIAHQPDRHVFFRTARGVFLLFDPDATLRGGRIPAHGAEGPGHVCFRVPEDELDTWQERFEGQGIEVRFVSWEGGRSLYVHDPAGNLVELAPATIWGLPTGEHAPTFGPGD
mgnify:CR=1 FL=1